MLFLQITEPNTRTQKIFRFENIWREDPNCRNVVERGWCANIEMAITDRIKVCGKDLQRWGEVVRQNFGAEIEACRKRIKWLQGDRDIEAQAATVEEKKKLGLLFQQRSDFWRQRAKLFWLQTGDSTLKAFFQYATSRRRKNNFS